MLLLIFFVLFLLNCLIALEIEDFFHFDQNLLIRIVLYIFKIFLVGRELRFKIFFDFVNFFGLYIKIVHDVGCIKFLI